MKTCTKCELNKSEEDFSWRDKIKNIKHNKCKMCVKLYGQKHYVDNKDLYKTRAHSSNKVAIKRNRIFLYNYLQEHPCVDCGETDIIVLQFDHLRDKTIEVARLVAGACSIEKIKAEIDKCEVVCSNCHMRRTAKRHGGWFKTKYVMGS